MHITPNLAEMRAARLAGETVRSIADRLGVNPKSIYQSFARNLGGTPLPGPANENNPHRKTHMSARNGGCSSTSGMMPVTLPRIATMSRDPVPMSQRELLLAANDNHLAVSARQVAA